MMAAIRCKRCSRRWREQHDWSVIVVDGRIVELFCPDCKTPDEAVEAAVNEAMLDAALDKRGLIVLSPRARPPAAGRC
jgi:hypothetical protein